MRPISVSPETWEVFIETQRRMSPQEKLSMAFEGSALLRRLIEGALHDRHPSADSHEILLRYARLTLGDDLFRRAYGDQLGDDPADETVAPIDVAHLEDVANRMMIE